MVEIVEITELTGEINKAVERLYPQLSDSPPPDKAVLEEILASPASMFIAARNRPGDGIIVGILMLVVYRVLNGKHAWIEDVVVDEPYRRQGIGEALTRFAIQRAADLGANTVNLTSRPARAAANRLYQRTGFVQRKTNLYRYNVANHLVESNSRKV